MQKIIDYKTHFSNRSIFYFLIFITLALFSFSALLETHPHNDGAGFDGLFYRDVAQSFLSTIKTEGYDSFRIHRIFPFFVLNLIFSWCSIETYNTNLMYGIYFFHYINLFIQFLFFFKIAKFLKWTHSTKLILFSCLFFNYFNLKNSPYEPFQTDAFAISLSFISYYYILCKKTFLSLFFSILAFITLPLTAFLNIILLLFSQPKNKNLKAYSVPLFKLLPSLYLGAVFLILLLIKLFKNENTLNILLLSNASKFFFISNAFLTTIFLYCIMKKAQINKIPHYKSFFFQFSIKNLFLFLSPFILTKFILSFYTNSNYYYDPSLFLSLIILRPLKYPLIFLVNHITYWGILAILVILFFNSFYKNFIRISTGHYLVFFVFLFFSLDSESRHILSFLPFIFSALGYTLNELKISKKALSFLVVFQVILSHFYIPINKEGTLKAMQEGDFFTFPAQWYFMNFGPWLHTKSYLFWATISFFSIVFVYFLIKKTPRWPRRLD